MFGLKAEIKELNEGDSDFLSYRKVKVMEYSRITYKVQGMDS